jgi:hypothetical protein
MPERHELRWGGFAGLGFVVLALVGQFLPGARPAVDEGAGEIATFVSDGRTTLLSSALLFAAAGVLVVWFAAALSEAIRERAERSDLHLAVLGGTVLVASIVFVNSALVAASAYGVAGRSEELTFMMFEASALLTSMIGLASALPLSAAGVAITRTHLMPDWVGYLAVLAAVVAVVGAFAVFITEGAFVPGGVLMGLVPLLVAAAFILCASVYMVREHLPEVMAPKAMPQT